MTAANQLYSVFRNLVISNSNPTNVRTLFTATTRFREVVDRKEMLKTVPKLDEGTQGEQSVDIDYSMNK